MKKTLLVGGALLCWGSSVLFANPAPAALKVSEAIELAMANNLSIKSAAVQERIKKRASDFSFDKFYPNLSTSATALWLNDPAYSAKAIPVNVQFPQGLPNPSHIYTNPATSVYGYVYDYQPTADNLALGLTVQEIFSPAYLGMIDQAAIEYQKSTITRKKAESQIKAAVKKLFYQLLVQKQAIAVTQSRLDSAQERLRQAQLAFNLGQGSELNAQYAKANVESILPDLRAMKTQRVLALVKFEELLGLDRRDDLELIGSLDDETPAVAQQPAPVGERFDIAEAKMTVQQISSALRLTDLSLLPNLIFQYAADPVINDPTSGSRFTDTGNWRQKTGALSMTLQWSLTGLIPGSETQIKRAELVDQLALADETARVAEENARHDEDNQRQMIQDSVAKIGNLKTVASTSKRVFELSSESYKAGVGRLLDLQAAELSWQGAEIQLLNERLNLMSLVWDLESRHSPAL